MQSMTVDTHSLNLWYEQFKTLTVLFKKKCMCKYLLLRKIGNISGPPEEIIIVGCPTTDMSISKPMVKYKETISIRNSFMIPIHELQISSTFLQKGVVHTMWSYALLCIGIRWKITHCDWVVHISTQGRRSWGGAGEAVAPLAFCWEGQGGPLSTL